ncbi:MAG: guanylate kinase, partial [Elusimicrobia bacterium]|nr:guanylate kinase [Elusimicrobiota bacterium]
MKRKTHVFVISAPSGTGKTTICRQLLKRDHHLRRVVTVTTRKPRAGEQQGRDYCFVTKKQFISMIEHRLFLEYAKVHGEYYG